MPEYHLHEQRTLTKFRINFEHPDPESALCYTYMCLIYFFVQYDGFDIVTLNLVFSNC